MSVQHSDCLSHHSCIYRCTIQQLPVVPISHIYISCTVQHSNACRITLTHLQIMYCTAFKLPVIPFTHLQIMYCSAFKLSYHSHAYTDHVLYRIQTACHTTLAFTNRVLYSIQNVCHTTHTFADHVLYNSQTACRATHEFADLVYCTAVKLPVVTLMCTDHVQHSNCLPYHSHAFTDHVQHSNCLSYHSRIYISCTAFKLPVIPLAHIQIMYSIQTAGHTTLMHLQIVYSIQTACRTTHAFTDHVQHSNCLLYHLCIYRSCTVQQSNCLSYHTCAFTDNVQHSNCLSIIPFKHLQIMYSSQSHTTHTFTDHVHAATAWQSAKTIYCDFPLFYLFFCCFHEQVTNKTGMLRALTVASI